MTYERRASVQIILKIVWLSREQATFLVGNVKVLHLEFGKFGDTLSEVLYIFFKDSLKIR